MSHAQVAHLTDISATCSPTFFVVHIHDSSLHYIINGSSRTDFRRLSNWHLVLSSSAVTTATRRSSCAFSPFSTCITHCTLRWESFANFNSFSVCSSFVLSCWHCAALESYALLSLWLWLCHFSCSACWKAADSAHRLLFPFKLLTSASVRRSFDDGFLG